MAAPSIEELLERADSARLDGNYDEAVANYKRVLELDPNNARAHLGLGLIYSFGWEGMFAEACIELEKAIELSPPDPELWVYLGKAYQQVGWMEDSQEAFAKSKEAFQKALEIDPSNEEAIKQLRYMEEFGL